MSVPPTIAADQAIAKQNFAMSAVKKSAENAQAIAQILDEAARSAPVSSTRGTNVSTHA